MTQKLSSTLKSANVKHLIDKAKSGKTLTKAELMLVEEYEEQQALESGKATGAIILTSLQLQALFTCSKKNISDYVKAGMPRLANDMYDLKQCFDWYRHKYMVAATGKKNWQQENHRYSAAIKRLTLMERKKQLIRKEKVVSEWTLRASEIRQSLMALRYRLVNRLEGLGSEERFEAIDAECRDILNTFIRNGNYTLDTPNPPKVKGHTTKSKPIGVATDIIVDDKNVSFEIEPVEASQVKPEPNHIPKAKKTQPRAPKCKKPAPKKKIAEKKVNPVKKPDAPVSKLAALRAKLKGGK